MIVKNGTQITNILIGQQDYKTCILRLKNRDIIVSIIIKHL